MAGITATFAARDRISSQLGNMSRQGNKTTNVFKRMAKAAGTAFATKKVIDFGKQSVMTFASFEQQMAKVHSVTGASDAEFKMLNDTARELGRTTIFSASQVAQAETFMGMAGYTADEIKNSLAPTLDLAAASGEELSIVSDIVTDSMTGFQLKAKDTAMFTDVLAATATASNTNVGMMGSTFQYVAPLAGSLGYSIQDTSLAIGLMANAGIKGAKGGTALRASITRLVKPTKDSQKVIDKLGLSIKNNDGSMKSLGSVMTDLREKFKGLTDAEKTEYAANLFGQEAMSGMLAIIDASQEDYDKLTDSINDSEGAARAMAEMQEDTLAGSFKELKSATEGVMIDLGEKLAPAIKQITEYITENGPRISETIINLVENGIDKFNTSSKWIIDNKEIIKAGLISIGIAYGIYKSSCIAATVSQIAQNVAVGVGIVKSGLLTAAIVGLYIKDYALAAAHGVATAAQWALNAAMSANPIGLVTLAIAGFVAGIVIAYKKLDWFRNLVNKAWESIKGFGKSIGGVFKKIGGGIKGGFGKVVGVFGGKAPEFAEGVNNFDGGPAWVGETGEPEIVTGPTFGNLRKGSNVIGVDDTKDILSNNSNNALKGADEIPKFAEGVNNFEGNSTLVGKMRDFDTTTGPTLSSLRKSDNTVRTDDTKDILSNNSNGSSGNTYNIYLDKERVATEEDPESFKSKVMDVIENVLDEELETGVV